MYQYVSNRFVVVKRAERLPTHHQRIVILPDQT
jgi:hypothetical protein